MEALFSGSRYVSRRKLKFFLKIQSSVWARMDSISLFTHATTIRQDPKTSCNVPSEHLSTVTKNSIDDMLNIMIAPSESSMRF
jgi:hypothetical protein